MFICLCGQSLDVEEVGKEVFTLPPGFLEDCLEDGTVVGASDEMECHKEEEETEETEETEENRSKGHSSVLRSTASSETSTADADDESPRPALRRSRRKR
jgi:hypothetical protein